MLTGGIVRLSIAEEVLASGVDVVGLGTALAMNPELPSIWQRDASAAVDLKPVRAKDKAVASAVSMARVREQLRRIGRGRSPKPGTSPWLAFTRESWGRRGALRRYRAWLADRGAA